MSRYFIPFTLIISIGYFTLASPRDVQAKKPVCPRGHTYIGCLKVDERGCCQKGVGQKACEIGTTRLNCRKKDLNQWGCCLEKEKQREKIQKGVDWLFVEGGKFKMGAIWGEGDSDELPLHWVKIESLYVSRNEITVAQYEKCVQAGVCTLPQTGGLCNWGIKQRAKHPVNCVTWSQARTYAQWVGGDLPSEAQWEYFARNRGYNQLYPWGKKEPSCEHALFLRGLTGCHGFAYTDEVCKRPKGNSEQGVCDLLGNVSEWTLDLKLPYTDQTSNGQPNCVNETCSATNVSNRIARGGGWDDRPQNMTVTHRSNYDPQYPRYNVGIRPVRLAED